MTGTRAPSTLSRRPLTTLLPAMRVANLSGFVELFAQLALHELDFRLEALNAAESAAILDDAGIDGVTVPLPRPGLVTQRVLVMPFVKGVRYDQALDRFGSDLDGAQLLHTAIHAVLLSTLHYGVSHGDVELQCLQAALQIEADALNRRDGGTVTFDRLGITLARHLRVFAANGFAMPKELVLFFENLMYLASFAAGVAPDLDVFDAVTAVIYEIAAAHPELFAA